MKAQVFKSLLLGLFFTAFAAGCSSASKKSYCDIVDAVNVESTAETQE